MRKSPGSATTQVSGPPHRAPGGRPLCWSLRRRSLGAQTRQRAPVHDQALAGDERGDLAVGEEPNGVGDLLRPPDSPQWRALLQMAEGDVLGLGITGTRPPVVGP